MKIFYKPNYFYLFLDFLILLLTLFVILNWFPFTTHSPFTKYSSPSLLFIFLWLVFSYLLKRYKPLRKQEFYMITIRLFYASTANFVVFMSLIYYFYKPYSGFVLLTSIILIFGVNYLFLSIYYAYRLAVEYNEINFVQAKERINAIIKPLNKLDDESFAQRRMIISTHSTENGFEFLESQVDLLSGNTVVFTSNSVLNLQMYPNYQYSSIVQLERLNNMRDINKRLAVINEKLPDKGIFICCFESKSTRKKRILRKYPKIIGPTFYGFDFIFKRILPKFFFTKRLYYFITKGENRIFTKAEVLGRLYCFGFKILNQKKIGQLTYVVAERVKQPESVQKKNYGLLIRLSRFGKNAEMITVYKMRTMHPFSEYLQQYLYERNKLNSSGKFHKDIRITTIGRFMRKYWIDELPMIFNLLSGEMKLVGVRPLSKQYFNLYKPELQEKRVKHKPGLLPPFYADMPQTLDEIQQSEMKYLNECEANGTIVTDFKYLILILKNIFIKKARSG